jgi:hypothetical protein
MKISDKFKLSTLIFLLVIIGQFANAQLVINEGSNKNFSNIKDEDSDHPDWIELYNNTADTINLYNYSLTDEVSIPNKWIFPAVNIAPHGFMKIFCSSKNRKPLSGFQQVLNTGSFTPVVGWNTHEFSEPFYWDGVSNVLINTCSFNANGYTVNSVFNQTATAFRSTLFSYVDYSADACGHTNGTPVNQRPNLKINGHIIGTGNINNSPYDYPAPYGNWYWSARNQMLIRAQELIDAGLSQGWMNNLSFDVVSTDPNTQYSYIDISFKLVNENELSGSFQALNNTLNLHTNFSIGRGGETVYLFSPTQSLQSKLTVDCISINNSKGRFPDAAANDVFFKKATPNASNNNSLVFHQYLQQPQFSKASGQYANGFSVIISNPNHIPSTIRYTLDGSEPVDTSTIYIGNPININISKVLKAKAFADSVLPSPLKAATYLIGISHSTPILSVITDNVNLYGTEGIFDHWEKDWEKEAYAEYFNTDRSLIFSQPTAIQIDGGAGGSRSQPQHSFRLELDNSVLGGGPIYYPLIPDKSYRNKYSKIYLRNGSNQYLTIPYKDACGVKVLADETHNYYAAYRPVSVYINGAYFGLYELREKFDDEYFQQAEQADSIEILSKSYWYGGVLRAVSGSVDSFYNVRDRFEQINPADADFWKKADQYFDMEYYNDYIIAQSFIGNRDWPFNNIKIYRSKNTHNRYRYAIIDVELALNPLGWTTSNDDPIAFLFRQDPNDLILNVWKKGIQNATFKRYFINRFADVLNTAYLPEKITQKESVIYNEMAREMPKEYARWGDPANISQQMNDFTNNHLALNAEYACRGEKLRSFIDSGFGLNGQVEITLNVFPNDAGKIKISTITPGPLPWKGIYFHGNPVEITAMANPGYTFSYWDTNAVLRSIDTTKSLQVDVTKNTSFNAYFLKTPFGLPSNQYNDIHASLFPNPGNGKFSIYLNDVDNGHYDIIIQNALGEIIQKELIFVNNRKGIVTPDISKTASGVYFIKIMGINFNKTLKYLKLNN